MIAINSLNYTYPQGTQPALQDICLKISRGDFVLLAGSSGSGKSTLLRCVNGLTPHFSGGSIKGEVQVNGLDVIALGPQALSAHIGFVQQSPESQAVLDKVEPEIAFALENAAIPAQEMRVRVEETLDLLDLAPLRTRSINTLSGGERQRVAIAAALALRPEILLLDEPTSQLDPQSAEDVLRALVRLNEDLGLTIILAEHRLERVLRYVDHLIYLENGRILTMGDVRHVIDQVPQLPPLVRVGRALDWQPLPFTVKEGRRFARVALDNKISLSAASLAANGGRASAYQAVNAEKNGADNLLETHDLSFAYNGSNVLTGVDIHVASGEAVAVMGRNGSGKSTLLKCITGLLTDKKGTIKVNGRSTAGLGVAEIAREVGYLPQNPDDLLFAESVTEELTITLRNHNLLRQNGVGDMLTELDLAPVAQAYPRDLSVGQRQRVALGAVTITRPPLLLLDEPTRGLDYDAKQKLVSIWRRWLAEGMGLLLVTHDVELAAQIADRVFILSQGEIIASGETAVVLGTSPLFAPQIARLFPDTGWLTVEDALAGLKVAG